MSDDSLFPIMNEAALRGVKIAWQKQVIADRGHRRTQSLKARHIVKENGPYEVSSLANGAVRVEPAWPQHEPFHTYSGGGPGVCDRLALAAAIADYLNGA